MRNSSSHILDNKLSRRQLLSTTGLTLGAGVCAVMLPATTVASAARSKRSETEPFGYCLNTSTIRGQKLDLPSTIDLVAEAGYDAVEPWMRELDHFVKQGGSLRDLGKRISDRGLTVESAIGFSAWIVDNDEKRKQALEQAKREMDMLRQIGGIRIAAPPVGATKQTDLDLFRAAKRYRALLELGASMGVLPQVEVWGFSKSLSRLGESVFVAIESGHADACLLADVYHIYKGGSDFTGLKMLGANAMHVFHVNDYPLDPPREKINDAARVYPGDGAAPLDDLFQTLRDIGFRGMLSLELFNREYWKQDAKVVLKTGLDKTRAAVHKALS